MLDGAALATASSDEASTRDVARLEGLNRRLTLGPLITFVGGSILFGVLGVIGYKAVTITDSARFELLANDLVARISDRLTTQVALLDGVGALHNAAPAAFDAVRFRAYVSELPLETRYPGMSGVGFVRRTSADRQDAVAERVQAMYGQPVTIHPRIATGEGFPVTLFEATGERPRVLLGYDMASENQRRHAMERARDTATPAATARVTMYSPVGGSRPEGFVIYRPVYTRGPDPQDVAARRARLLGHAFAPFNAQEFFSAVLDTSALRFAGIEVFDGPPEEGRAFYRSNPGAPDGRHVATQSLDVAGQTFFVRATSRPAFDSTASAQLVAPLAGLGLLLAATAAALVRQRILVRIGEEEERANTLRTARDKDLLLQEMKHRIKNALARVQAVARQTARGSTSLPEFIEAFEARLSAMSATHDLLTRSRWEGADLRDVLVAEIEPVLGTLGEAIAVEGPAVALDARQVLALGLTIHELATNAVKYGGVTRQGGSLSVRWHREILGADRRLVLDWVERRSPDAPPGAAQDPPHRGFGTRLIETTITHELGGVFHRTLEPQGHTCRISIPLAF
ncbi:MAG TPA: CHASE domain-containing protein [Methylomirabilota bacterium]|nr:CHASE domain-containing protein [Methylomirabilota bacterium]